MNADPICVHLRNLRLNVATARQRAPETPPHICI